MYPLIPWKYDDCSSFLDMKKILLKASRYEEEDADDQEDNYSAKGQDKTNLYKKGLIKEKTPPTPPMV